MIFTRVEDVDFGRCFLELPGFLDGHELFVKIDGLNAAGSIKLRPARAMIEAAEQRGLLGRDGRLIESSSGSLGIALSMLAASRRYSFTCVVDPNISAVSRQVMQAHGADVVTVTERDTNGGYLHSRIAEVRRRVEADPALVWLNQYANPANASSHFSGTARTVFEEFPAVDVLVVGVGTSGTLMGCSRYVREHAPGTMLVAVDTAGSITFGGPTARRFVPGLGASRRPELFDPGAADRYALVSESSAVAVCRHLARHHGLLCGGSTGAILAAARALAAELPPGARVVALSPDLGDRYIGTVYDNAWSMSRLGPIRTDIDDLDVRFVPSSDVASAIRERSEAFT